MELSNQNQTNKSLPTQWKAKLEETLDLAKGIISRKSDIPFVEMGLSITQTLSKPTIRTVFKDENGKVGYAVVKILVERFLASFTFATKLTEDQIEMLTVDTMENFGYESLQDIILFFKMGRSGKFGAAKKGIDSNLVFGEWFPKYLELKAELREQEYEKSKNHLNSNPVNYEAIREAYKKAADKKNKDEFVERVKNFVDRITKDIDREMLESLIIDWNNDPERKPYIDILKRKRTQIK